MSWGLVLSMLYNALLGNIWNKSSRKLSLTTWTGEGEGGMWGCSSCLLPGCLCRAGSGFTVLLKHPLLVQMAP